MNQYVHGYSTHESTRLQDQSLTLCDLLHHDTIYSAGSRVLEAGCGIGAQTIHLTTRNPDSYFTSMDISRESIQQARESMAKQQIDNVEFLQGDIFSLPFPHNYFDHVFICFVLEHLPHPQEALNHLMRVLKPGGTLTAIEGDHGSCFFYPRSERAYKPWNALIDLQAEIGGDALIGRSLYPLLHHAGLRDIDVTPRVVYVDASKPRLQDGFVRKTIIAMVEGVKEKALSQGLMTQEEWEAGIEDLHKTGQSPDGTFYYTFFKGIGVK